MEHTRCPRRRIAHRSRVRPTSGWRCGRIRRSSARRRSSSGSHGARRPANDLRRPAGPCRPGDFWLDQLLVRRPRRNGCSACIRWQVRRNRSGVSPIWLIRLSSGRGRRRPAAEIGHSAASTKTRIQAQVRRLAPEEGDDTVGWRRPHRGGGDAVSPKPPGAACELAAGRLLEEAGRPMASGPRRLSRSRLPSRVR